jgi:hypothetical protein
LDKTFNPRGDGGKRASLSEESAKQTVKTIRVRECRVISGASAVNTRVHTYYPSAHEAAGALAPGIPHALTFSGRTILARLGRIAPRGANVCLLFEN